MAQLLAVSGRTVVSMPAFRFLPNPTSIDPTGQWRDSRSRLAVFTSPRAVEFGLQAVPDGFLDDARLAVLGPASAAALERAGLSADLMPAVVHTSESLLQIPGLSEQVGEAIIFAAPGGREVLGTGLRELGWGVQMALVYRREGVNPDVMAVEDLRSASRVLSVWTSANAMQWLLEQLPQEVSEQILNGDCVVISDRLSELARSLGADSVVMAHGPDNKSIQDCVMRLID